MTDRDRRRCVRVTRELLRRGGTPRTLAAAARQALMRRRPHQRVVRFEHAGITWHARMDWLGVRVSVARDDNIVFLRSYDL